MSNLPPSGEIPRGAIRFNTDSNKLELWNGSQWAEFQLSTPNLGQGTHTQPGVRGILMGGRTPSESDEIDYINIASTGNSTDFGNLLATASRGFANGQTSSSVRGLAMGGQSTLDDIQSITIASTGNATMHSGLLTVDKRLAAGASSSTRAITGGGLNPTSLNVIDATDIASLGSAIDFGDLSAALYYRAGLSSPTRAIIAGGYNPAPVNTIEFVTISTQGNSADFGDLTQATMGMGAGGNSTRGIFYGGGLTAPSFPNTDVISYITIGTLGNAQDFGDATQSVEYAAVASSPTRLVAMGGIVDPAFVNTMAYVQIPTIGNAVDFGDLTGTARQRGAACSNGHGGL